MESIAMLMGFAWCIGFMFSIGKMLAVAFGPFYEGGISRFLVGAVLLVFLWPIYLGLKL